jgi:hypothetical protein
VRYVCGKGGRLLDKLAAAGARPDDVQTVILLDLHPDYVGWNRQPRDSGFRPTFLFARYVTRRANWEAAFYSRRCRRISRIPSSRGRSLLCRSLAPWS